MWEFDKKKFTRNTHLHSKEHVLADDLSRMMGEEKRFASYLGLAQLYAESDLRALAQRVLEKDDLPRAARGKYFFASVKGLVRKPGVRLKRKKRISKKQSKKKSRHAKRTNNRKKS